VPTAANCSNAALGLIDTTELNAVVIDVKGDRGMIAFKSDVSLAAASHGNWAASRRPSTSKAARV